MDFAQGIGQIARNLLGFRERERSNGFHACLEIGARQVFHDQIGVAVLHEAVKRLRNMGRLETGQDVELLPQPWLVAKQFRASWEGRASCRLLAPRRLGHVLLDNHL